MESEKLKNSPTSLTLAESSLYSLLLVPEVTFIEWWVDSAFAGWTCSQLPMRDSRCQGLFPALLPCSGETLHPELPAAQGKHGAVRVSPERHQDVQRDGAALLEGKAERIEIVLEKRSSEAI